MAAIFARVAALGAKTGGKVVAKQVAKTGGKAVGKQAAKTGGKTAGKQAAKTGGKNIAKRGGKKAVKAVKDKAKDELTNEDNMNEIFDKNVKKTTDDNQKERVKIGGKKDRNEREEKMAAKIAAKKADKLAEKKAIKMAEKRTAKIAEKRAAKIAEKRAEKIAAKKATTMAANRTYKNAVINDEMFRDHQFRRSTQNEFMESNSDESIKSEANDSSSNRSDTGNITYKQSAVNRRSTNQYRSALDMDKPSETQVEFPTDDESESNSLEFETGNPTDSNQPEEIIILKNINPKRHSIDDLLSEGSPKIYDSGIEEEVPATPDKLSDDIEYFEPDLRKSRTSTRTQIAPVSKIIENINEHIQSPTISKTTDENKPNDRQSLIQKLFNRMSLKKSKSYTNAPESQPSTPFIEPQPVNSFQQQYTTRSPSQISNPAYSNNERSLSKPSAQIVSTEIDHQFNMMLFKIAKDMIMEEYTELKDKKKTNCQEQNDDWLKAFEMVIKHDNARDIRSTKVKRDKIKLEMSMRPECPVCGCRSKHQNPVKHLANNRNLYENQDSQSVSSSCSEYDSVCYDSERLGKLISILRHCDRRKRNNALKDTFPTKCQMHSSNDACFHQNRYCHQPPINQICYPFQTPNLCNYEMIPPVYEYPYNYYNDDYYANQFYPLFYYPDC